MSAPVDSLSIKVDASARGANQQLDKLVQKMIQLRSSINGIKVGNLNTMSVSIQNFSKAATGLNQVKTSDFTRMAKNIEKLTNVNSSNLDKSAQSVEKAANSLQRASSVSKKAIYSGLKFDSSGAQDMQKAIQSLSNEYADAGKGKTFEGSLSELEKQADKLIKKLDDLAEKEEKILAVGGTSAESKAFKNLQYDITKTMNQLVELEAEIAKVRSAEKQDISSLPIFRYDSPSIDLTETSELAEFQEEVSSIFKEIPESAKYSVETAQKSLQDALKEVHIGDGENSEFRNYTEQIKSLESNLKSLEQSGKGIGSDEWDEAYIALYKVNAEVKDYKKNLLRPWTEGDEEIQKTNSLGNRVEELNAKLKELKANGLNFGDADFDGVYRNLQRATGELKEYKAILNKPATGIDEEIKKTNSLGNCVEQLKAKLKDLQSQGLNFGDAEYDKTYRDLQKSTAELKKYKANLNDTGNTVKKLGDAFGSIWNQTKKAGSGIIDFGTKIKNLKNHVHSMSASTNSLVGQLGKLYIGFRSLKSVTSSFKDSVGSSMDYIEEYNYFSTTMDKIASEWSMDYKKYGYENADEYGKSFKNRLTETLTKMTGFQMEDDGTLTDNGTKNLGLDVTEMTNYAAGVAQVTNSVGLVGEASTVTSKALSMLAGDMSSFRNQDMSTVMNNFSSGLIGQSRALYQYGIDITNATLATYAHDLGIKKNITDMTQAEKMQLRMIAILDQSKVAWGDLAKTINSPSNQLRLLQNNFKTLSRTIGNIFLPAVAKVLPYLNGLVIAIRKLFEWTASMLGIDLSDIIQDSGVGGSDAFDGLEEDANDASSAVDDTTDSVKKLAKQLMGFDELNVITTNQSSSNSSDSGDSAPIDLTSQLAAALADYEEVWNKAYSDMTSDAEKFANKLTNLFKSAWTSGDGSDIGSAIATWINKGIKWINSNVDTFATGLKKLANIMATSFNGFVEKLEWAGLGTAIGKSLKAFFDAETHFFDTVNWTNFGSSLATSANAAISTGVIQSYIKLIASKLKAAIETAFGAVTTFKFDNLGTAIGQGIKDFFNTMGEVNKETGLNGWEELGVTITKSISGISVSIATALKEADIGKSAAKAIVDLLGSVDTGDIGWNIGGLVSSLVTEFYNLVSDKTMWTELGNKVADGINKFFKSMNNVDDKTHLTGWETLGKSISKTITGLGDSIITALDGVDWPAVGQGIGDAVKSIDFVGVSWKFVKIGDSIFGAVVDALTEFIKTAPATSAFVAAFGVLKLTGLDTKISSLVTTFLGKHNLTLGKAVIGIGLAAATFRLADSDDKIKSLIGAPITAALAGYTFTGNIKLSLGIAGVTFAVTGGFSLGELIGKAFQDATTGDEMKQYRYDLKFSDLISYSPTEWAQGFKSWWEDIDPIGTITEFFTSGDFVNFRFKIPFTDIELPSTADTTKKILGYIGMLGTFAFTLYATVKEKTEGALNKLKETWESVKSKTAELVADAKEKADGTLAKLRETWDGIKNSTAVKTLQQAGKDTIDKVKASWDAIKSGKAIKTLAQSGKSIIDSAKKSWDAIKNGKATKTMKQKGKDVISAAAKAWDKIKDSEVTKTLKQKGQSALDKVKKAWDSLQSKKITVSLVLDAVKSGIKLIIDWINKYIIGAINKISVKIPSWVPKMGGKTFGFDLKKISIPAFASGGFPQRGQYFLARENGPELVGTIGRKTAVANNAQIVQSVSDGIFNVMAPVLTQVVNSVNALNSKIDSISGNGVDVEKYTEGDLLKVVRKEDSSYRKRTGKSAFAY